MDTVAIDAPDGAGDGVLRRSAFWSCLAAMVSSSVFRVRVSLCRCQNVANYHTNAAPAVLPAS